MITLNGSKFAESESEFTESLFISGGTCKGYAKRYKRRIDLMNMQKERIGVINKFGVLCCATKTKEGYWYNLADIDEVGKYDSYGDSYREPRSYGVYDGCDSRGDTVYNFSKQTT